MDIPRGLEVLLKKASVDAEFCALLLENRADAGATIGLDLDPAERAMLNAMPTEQLDAIIHQTRVPPQDRRIFLGKVASLMLAALGTGVSGCKKEEGGEPGPRRTSRGHAADNPGRTRPPRPPSPGAPANENPGTAATS